MVRQCHVSIAGVQFQINLSIDQTFIIFMIIAKERDVGNRGEHRQKRVLLSNEILLRLIRGDRSFLTIDLSVSFVFLLHW